LGPLATIPSAWLRTKKRFFETSQKKEFHLERDPLVAKSYANQIQRMLRGKDIDAILSPGTIPISYLQTCVPIAVWTDATFGGLVGFYPEFSNLSSATLKSGHALERRALNNCSLAVYTSNWAAHSAAKTYGLESRKLRVIPFGANIEFESSWHAVRIDIASRGFSECRLLFLGSDWNRKGGPAAVQLALKLRESGMPCSLTVIGCSPSQHLPDLVNVVGFVSKQSPEGIATINRALATSHFLILPTIADCVPVVFAEAFAHGLPVISTNIGGIPSIISHGKNGFVFNAENFVTDAANTILEILCKETRYTEVCEQSYSDYLEYFNWNVAGRLMKAQLERICCERHDGIAIEADSAPNR